MAWPGLRPRTLVWGPERCSEPARSWALAPSYFYWATPVLTSTQFITPGAYLLILLIILPPPINTLRIGFTAACRIA